MTKDKAMQQALELIERLNQHGWILADFEDEVYATLNSLKAALEQPVQEPVACRFCHSKKGSWTWQCYHCGEIDDVQKPAPSQQQAGSVSMRMPKVGDKVICLEDESLGEVVSLTAGGSPDILFDDGSHGTYMVREFAELFGYVTSLLPEQAQRQWVGLTGLEQKAIMAMTSRDAVFETEAKLKEKNHG